jgi:hypothetical protein
MCVDVAAYHGFCLLAFGVCIRKRSLMMIRYVSKHVGAISE